MHGKTQLDHTTFYKATAAAKGRAFADFSFAIFDYLDIYAGRQAEKERLYADIMD